MIDPVHQTILICYLAVVGLAVISAPWLFGRENVFKPIDWVMGVIINAPFVFISVRHLIETCTIFCSV